MKTLRRILGLAVIGTMVLGARLEAQQQPAPAAPEPAAPDPAAPQPAPAIPGPENAVPAAEQPAQPDDAGALQAPPQAETPPDNPFGQPPAEPSTVPPTEPPPQPQPPMPQPPQQQPPYSPVPATPAVDGIIPPEDPFLPPPGMVTPPDCLIDLLGFFGHHPFVYSDSNCFDLASAAYRYGYYLDAIALLSHAIEQTPQAHYYYLRGMAQMKAGLPHEAIASADGVLDAISAGDYGGLDRVSERFNGPLGKQFQELLDLRRAAR